jgi:tetratricopeptide (TPR) repeat protein
MARRLVSAISAIHAMALVLAPAQTTPKPRVALVIGNARYEAAVGPLRNAVNDAKAVAKTLRGLGFSVTEEHNVSRDDLIEAVAGFRARIKGAEVALFYYAGHGVSVGGSNYLIPIKSGYQPEGGDDATLRMLAETKLFNAEQAVAEMSAAGGRCNLVILDACRSTPIARNLRSRDAANPGGLAEMNPPAGSLIAFATDAGHTARDGDGANGLYTGELVKHLQTPGLTIEQVFKRARAGVMERSDGAQIPAEYSRLVGDDIYLAGPTAPVPAPPPEPTLPKAAPVKIPTSRAINQLAAAGHVAECIEALRVTAAANGPGDFAAAPLDALLESVKEDLKQITGPSPKVAQAMKTCQLALDAIRDCLPPDHARKSALTAKASNRLGDCLLLSGRAEEALQSYDTAVELAPDDSYPVFNRGRAHLALGHTEEAKADFTTASNPKFNQPTARKLAQKALADMQ